MQEKAVPSALGNRSLCQKPPTRQRTTRPGAQEKAAQTPRDKVPTQPSEKNDRDEVRGSPAGATPFQPGRLVRFVWIGRNAEVPSPPAAQRNKRK